jgi:hypothetical protein
MSGHAFARSKLAHLGPTQLPTRQALLEAVFSFFYVIETESWRQIKKIMFRTSLLRWLLTIARYGRNFDHAESHWKLGFSGGGSPMSSFRLILIFTSVI